MMGVETSRETSFQRAPSSLPKEISNLTQGSNTMERILVVEDDHAVQKALKSLF